MTDQEYNSLIASLALKFAQAVALAEGYYVAGSLPNRINNPGDLELGDRGYGVEQQKTIYFTAEDGWDALERECTAILTGSSHVYSVDWTLSQVASKWTGGDNDGAWVKIVVEKLNLDPMTTIADWVKGVADADVNNSQQT